MRTITIIYSIVGVQCVLILCQIYKNAQFVEQLFEKQKNEKRYALLQHELNELQCQLHSLQDYGAVRKFARTTLSMDTIKKTQIRAVENDSAIIQD